MIINPWLTANKIRGIALYFCLTLLLITTSFWLNTDRLLAHRPHDDIYAIALSPNYSQDQTAYTVVRGNYFKSNDQGNTWRRITEGIDNLGFINNIITPTNNNTLVYLSSLGDGIYKSTDSGESWLKINTGLENLNLELLTTTPDGKIVIAAGKTQGLYYSNDSGKNWQTIIKNKKISAIAINSAQPDYLLISNNQGEIYSSLDQGKNWQLKSKISTDAAITAIAFSPNFIRDQTIYLGTNKQGIWISQDAGKNFTPLPNSKSLLRVQDIVAIANKNQQTTLYVSEWEQGLFCSEDGGKTWQKYSQGLTKSSQADEPAFLEPHFRNIAISPNFNLDQTLFIAGFNGLFKSSNRGKNWQELTALSPRTVVGLALSPNYPLDETIAIVNYVGESSISHDLGKTWQPTYKGQELPRFTGDFDIPEDDPRRFFDVAFSPNYSADGRLFYSTLRSNFLTSSDRGQTWNLIHLPEVPGYIRGNLIAVSPNFAADKTVYVATNRGHLYQSTNQGKNFAILSEIKHKITSLIISPNFAIDQTIYASSSQAIYQSKDSGKTWHNILKDADLKHLTWLNLAISANYAQDRTIFAGAERGVYQSTDGGKNWRHISSLTPGVTEAIALSPNYAQDLTWIVSIRGKGAWKTTDDGKSFTPVGKLNNQTLPFSRVYGVHSASVPLKFSPNFSQDRTIYGFGSAQAEIYRSTDAGDSWNTISIPAAPIWEAYRHNQYDFPTMVNLILYLYRSYIWFGAIAFTISLVGYFLVRQKY